MKNHLMTTVLLIALALLAVPATYAADSQEKPSLAPVSHTIITTNIVAKQTPPATLNLVDINSASASELITLPGIAEAEAAKIMAGRPYGSKAWLVTKGILPEDKYPALKDRVIAKQPFKDAAKNIENLKNQKKPASK